MKSPALAQSATPETHALGVISETTVTHVMLNGAGPLLAIMIDLSD